MGKAKLRGDAAGVARLLGGVVPHQMVSDPPYGVIYDPAWRNKADASETRRIGKVMNDDRADWREAWALFPGDVAYAWHGALHATTVKVLGELGCGDIPVRHVKDIDEIAQFGPLVTPGLVVGGHLLLSGRVPSESVLRRLLRESIE